MIWHCPKCDHEHDEFMADLPYPECDHCAWQGKSWDDVKEKEERMVFDFDKEHITRWIFDLLKDGTDYRGLVATVFTEKKVKRVPVLAKQIKDIAMPGHGGLAQRIIGQLLNNVDYNLFLTLMEDRMNE